MEEIRKTKSKNLKRKNLCQGTELPATCGAGTDRARQNNKDTVGMCPSSCYTTVTLDGVMHIGGKSDPREIVIHGFKNKKKYTKNVGTVII